MDNYSHVPIPNPTSTDHVVNSPELTPTGSQLPMRSRFPITNGLLRRFQPVDTTITNYRECLRNHSAGLGGLAVDGCGGYIPLLSYDPSNPTLMNCMVCGCHRNFHRMENDVQPAPILNGPAAAAAAVGRVPNCTAPSLTYFYPPPQRMVLNVSSEIQQEVDGVGGSTSKRRKRTKFSSEQKVRMYEMAEKIEWKLKKDDDEMIQVFCSEVGIQRNVFKVWMHNNKCILGHGKRNADGNIRVQYHEDNIQLHELQIVEGNEFVVANENENVANVSSSSSSSSDRRGILEY